MLTYTMLKNRAVSMVGTNEPRVVDELVQDINQGLRLFKNAARRYWTRQEKITGLVNGQQYYQMPSDMVRVTEVKVVANGLSFPLREISSEYEWNRLNIIPAVTINVPTYYFVRGYNEIGLWPTPSYDESQGLTVSYEPRLKDMNVEDITGQAQVTYEGLQVVDTSNPFVPQMVGRWIQITDGTDGQWYKISGYDSASTIELENYFEGLSGNSRPYVIGEAPDIPEEYHMALVYYAAQNFFQKRKDNNTSTFYKGLFDDAFNAYRAAYSDKSTGVVMNSVNRLKYNIFSIPPNTMV